MPNPFSFLPDSIVAVILLLAMGFGIGFLGLRLSARHGADVRAIWYLYFLAFISTGFVALWASQVGAIDSDGSFQGAAGKNLKMSLDLMLDLNADMLIMTTIAALVLGPQLGSYLVSGFLFGCAAPMLLIGRTFNIYIWSLAKSFVVVAGILQSMSLYGWTHNWLGWNGKGAGAMSMLSLMLIFFAFSVLHMYRDMSDEQAKITENNQFALVKERWNRFMTRRLK